MSCLPPNPRRMGYIVPIHGLNIHQQLWYILLYIKVTTNYSCYFSYYKLLEGLSASFCQSYDHLHDPMASHISFISLVSLSV